VEFERAAHWGDRIKAFDASTDSQVSTPRVAEADINALHMVSGPACVQGLRYSVPTDWGIANYYPRVGPREMPRKCWRPFIGPVLRHPRAAAAVILSNESNPDLLSRRCRASWGARLISWAPTR